MFFRIAADVVLVIHLLFIAFVVLGGVWTFRQPLAALIHVPAALWGTFVELAGRSCPLTALEVRLRELAGDAGYAESFIEHYILPVVYPAGLSRGVQLSLAGLVVGINFGVYGWLLYRRHRPRADSA